MLGIEAVPSQSTLTRFFGAFNQQVNAQLNALNHWVAGAWPSAGRDGYTLDVDSWALLHEDGHQEGVEVGYTRLGLKPCHRPLVGVLAEQKVVVHYWLRRGDSACVNNAGEFIGQCLDQLPAHLRVGLVRGDSGFCAAPVKAAVRARGAHYILVARLNQKLQTLCRHEDACWQSGGDGGSGGGLATGLTAHRHPPAHRGAAGGGRQDAAGCPGLPLSSVGDFAAGGAHAAGGLAAL